MSGSSQFGFGICASDELHGDIEYYYVVEHTVAGTVVGAYTVENDDAPRIGRLVREVAVPRPFFSSFASARRTELLARAAGA